MLHENVIYIYKSSGFLFSLSPSYVYDYIVHWKDIYDRMGVFGFPYYGWSTKKKEKRNEIPNDIADRKSNAKIQNPPTLSL